MAPEAVLSKLLNIFVGDAAGFQIRCHLYLFEKSAWESTDGRVILTGKHSLRGLTKFSWFRVGSGVTMF
jgi:hypothetical protein